MSVRYLLITATPSLNTLLFCQKPTAFPLWQVGDTAHTATQCSHLPIAGPTPGYHQLISLHCSNRQRPAHINAAPSNDGQTSQQAPQVPQASPQEGTGPGVFDRGQTESTAASPLPPSAQGQQDSADVPLISYRDVYWGYTGLMLTGAVLGAVTLFKSNDAAQQLLGVSVVSAQDVVCVKLLGASVVIGAIIDYCLQDAANRYMLGATMMQSTYQQLAVAAIIRYACYTAALALHPDAATAASAAVLLLISLSGTAVHTFTLIRSTREAGSTAATPEPSPLTAVSAVYLLLCGVYAAKAAVSWHPELVFQGGLSPGQQLLSACWSGSFMAAALVSLTLSDCEAKGRLGTQVCKTLNIGLAGLELTSRGALSVVLLRGGFVDEGVGYAVVGSSVAIAAFCSTQYFVGKLR